MDGLDLSAIDQDVFNGSPMISDEEEGNMPIPDCIGIDSAVQDDEQVRLKRSENENKKAKTRSEVERELELKILKPDSIRRQILEQSLKDGNNKVDMTFSKNTNSISNDDQTNCKSHVMDIVEKAGMRGIDKEKINEIIHEASKGSLFYKKQAQRQEEIHKSIERMLNKVSVATPLQVANAKITCDKIFQDIEKQRIFNRVIVHFDLDMFFAAVEIRDNPELADKPIAVGGDSMVSTSNYIARRYGVRAAMPGFIARKLCPELLLIKPNGIKYREASAEVFSILEQYDPELTGMSLDEAYLDLTDYLKNVLERDGLEIQEYYDGTLPKIWWSQASKVVEEIREAIFIKTKLTCSAGIACNTLLSKISTDINKPNGQFMVEGYPREVMEFIQKTPVGKVSGIGKVSGQFLSALDIKTCGDIYEKRHFLPLVFYEINVRFYLRVALGDGSTSIKSDEQRKSKSVERTFGAVNDSLILLDKLDSICEELCSKYLKPYRIRGRTITIKLKRNTFTTTTKSYSMLVPTNDKLVIYSASKNLLLSELANEPPEISYRLLGVKLSNLADEGVTTNQLTIHAMLKNQELSKITRSNSSVYQIEESKSNSTSSHDLEETIPKSESVDQKEDSIETDINGQNLRASVTNKTQERTNNGGIKRKTPPSKRIEDFFSAVDHKYPKRTHPIKDSIKFSPTLNSPLSPSGSSPKLSYYQKFIESNSQKLSKSPKYEPLQCPYCMHGFFNFEFLENHVIVCIKNDSSFCSDVLKQLIGMEQTISTTPKTDPTTTTPKPDFCSGSLTELDAFLYGLPGGLILAGLLLFCFVMFGNAITGQSPERVQASASSNTRLNRRDLLGKKKNRGPPPSVELKHVDMNQMALREDAPDDIRAMALAGKLSKIKVLPPKRKGSKLSSSDTRSNEVHGFHD